MSESQTPIDKLRQREQLTQDRARPSAVEKRHKKGFRTARENLADLCDLDTFCEYGQFAVAAQRSRTDYEQLKQDTPADGIITGTGSVNLENFGAKASRTAIVVNDYSVLAGTQGYFHHHKLDRMLELAKTEKLPVIMYTEGGGGRPGDTDIQTVVSGLNCKSFGRWAGLGGIVPRIAVSNGYCFAGNAALFGTADITIATVDSYIGMAGPAMIEGGGLGSFAPTDIGPIDVQSKNGVVDIIADDEQQATAYAKKALSYFQGRTQSWSAPDSNQLASALPDDRRFAYNVHTIIEHLADQGSQLELKPAFGGAIITAFIRINGFPVGLVASNCNVLGGAIDVDAAEKFSWFTRLCDQFNIPLVSLVDTPGFMVGPEHEKLGAARRLTQMFEIGSQLAVPMVGVVLRKCYGLGAQAMLAGGTHIPVYTVAWPQGEFGAMGLEGAVKLGFRKQLDAEPDPVKRKALFDSLVAQQYHKGSAIEVASLLEIDAVIDPVDTRQVIAQRLGLVD